jgi:hypothetical protein
MPTNSGTRAPSRPARRAAIALWTLGNELRAVHDAWRDQIANRMAVGRFDAERVPAGVWGALLGIAGGEGQHSAQGRGHPDRRGGAAEYDGALTMSGQAFPSDRPSAMITRWSSCWIRRTGGSSAHDMGASPTWTRLRRVAGSVSC